MKLTDMVVKHAVLPEGAVQEEIPDSGCRGLVLILGKASKAWQVRFRLQGKRHRMPLGRYPAVSLVEARALASAAMLKVDRGHDPRLADVGTVAAAWAGFWSMKAATLKHPDQDVSAWRNHLQPIIGDLPLDNLTPAAFDRLQAAWVASGLGPGQARPLRLLTGLQGWLLDRSLIDRPFIPRRIIRPASAALPVPSLDALQGLLGWCETRGLPGIQLALLAITGARVDMIQALRWSEVGEDHLSWPAARMKGGRAFDQPLSTAAMGWLVRVPRRHPVFVFPARHGRSESHINLPLHTAVSPIAGFRTHDLRAGFATHAQEALGVSPAVIGAVLDHSPASMLGVTSVYLKAGPRLLWAERRAALDAWAALLTGAG